MQKTILFFALVIIMMGFGIAIPLMPFYITHFNASASALGLMMSLYSLMQFLCAPLWGRWSDRVGRKPILLIGIAGYFISFILQGISQNITQLILARTLAGILSSATLPTAMAYIADITSEADRSKGVGLMGAAMGVGMIFGPSLGGLLSGLILPFPPAIQALLQITTSASTGEVINLSIPFFASALLALIAVPFIAFLLPESLTAEERAKHAAHPNQSRLAELLDGVRGPVGFLYGMAFLLAFSLACYESVLGLFGQERFLMTPTEIGLLMGAIGVLSVLQQGILIGPFTRRFGEMRLIQGGLIISIAGFIFLALSFSKGSLAAGTLVLTFGNALLQPSVTSLISKQARSGQGAAMGLNNSFQSLGRTVGPLWAGFSYDLVATLAFWTGAFVQVIGLASSAAAFKRLSKEQTVPPLPADTGSSK